MPARRAGIESTSPVHTPPLSAALIGVLAWVAGTVDTFGYLSLGNVFMSHLTGNAAVLAMSLVQGHFGEAIHRGLPIPLFGAGVCAGAWLSTRSHQLRHALGTEAGLLAAFAVVHAAARPANMSQGPVWVALLALLSVAMGIQNAASEQTRPGGVHTTHITGQTTHLITTMVSRAVADREAAPRHTLLRLSACPAAFFAGALCGTALFVVAPSWGLLVPAAVLMYLAGGGTRPTRQNP